MTRPTHRKRLWLWAAALSAILVIWAIPAIASEDGEYPLSLEMIWETPKKGEPVLAEGFPPVEFKEVLADTSIPEEDKEWVLNNIRLWAAYKTKKLWLDDGSTMDISVVQPNDRLRTFTIFPSRNKKYWLVRAMRFEGPEIPPEPEPPPGGAPTPEFGAAKSARLNAQWQQKAHWREAFMDVEGRIYWEKEFGPYDTYLEDSWLGEVLAHVADDGASVVTMRRPRGSSGPGLSYAKHAYVCDRQGTRHERKELAGGKMMATALSSNGSVFAVLRGSDTESQLAAYALTGEELYSSALVPGEVGNPPLVDVSNDGRSAIFSVVEPRVDEKRNCRFYLTGSGGKTLGNYFRPGQRPTAARLSRNGEVAAVAFDHSILTADASDGSVLWEYHAEDGWPGSMWNLDMPSDGSLLVVSVIADQKRRPYPGELLIFSGEGALLLRKKSRVCDPSFSPDGAFLMEDLSGPMKIHRIIR